MTLSKKERKKEDEKPCLVELKWIYSTKKSEMVRNSDQFRKSG